MLIVAATKAKQLKDFLARAKGAFQLLADGGKAKKD
jgi:hypothetical protein